MRNAYEIRGDVVAIRLRRMVGPDLETVIDLADLTIADSFTGAWCARRDRRSEAFYVVGRSGPRADGSWFRLHRLIMGNPPGLDVDHRNHDTLNNRRHNLRALTTSQNLLNRRGPARNNKTGVLGVSLRTPNSFSATLIYQGNEIRLGHYWTAAEAGAVVAEYRARLLGEAVEGRALPQPRPKPVGAKTSVEFRRKIRERRLIHVESGLCSFPCPKPAAPDLKYCALHAERRRIYARAARIRQQSILQVAP